MADVTFTFSGDATSLQNALNEIKGEIGKTKESVQGLAGQFAASFAAIGAAIAFDVTVVDQPILTHPKMASISGGQLEYLKAFMDGARLWELVPEVDNSGKPKLDSDGLPVMKQLGKLLKPGSKAFDLINKGVTSYKDIMATYTVRMTSRSDKSDIDSVGTINTPPKAPKFKDRTWLQVSSNCSMNDDGKTYTIENTWLLSGLGGWDKDLYGA